MDHDPVAHAAGPAAGGPSVRPPARVSSEISLIGILAVLLRHRRLIVALPIVVSLGVMASAVLRGRSYIATASFIPQAAEPGNALSLVGEQLGIDLGGRAPGQSPEFYAELVLSRAILEAAAMSEYARPTEQGLRSATLLEIYGVGGETETERLRRAAERLEEAVTVRRSVATGLVEIEVRARTPSLAEQIAQRLLDLVEGFNVDVRRTQAAAEARFAGERLEEARAALEAAEDSLKTFLQGNVRFERSPELQFEFERLLRRVSMRERLYSTLAESYEQARIQQVRNTPLITVVEPATGSGRPMPRGTLLRGILGLVLGGALAVVIAFVKDGARRIRGSEDEEARELETLRREALEDLRRLARFRPRLRRARGAGKRAAGAPAEAGAEIRPDARAGAGAAPGAEAGPEAEAGPAPGAGPAESPADAEAPRHAHASGARRGGA